MAASESDDWFVTSVLRRKFPFSPLYGVFFTPASLTDLHLLRALEAVTADAITAATTTRIQFQRKNLRSLINKLRTFLSIFRFLHSDHLYYLSSLSSFRSSANLCFKELYIVIYRCKLLIDYCTQSNRIWMLLQNSEISGYFYELNLELSTVVDVFPAEDLGLISDLKEQIYLLRKQIRESKLYIDPEDDKLRTTVLGFLRELENGGVPNKADLQVAFAEKLGIRDPLTCRSEIEFLEERQFYGQEADADLLDGVIALTRYCRFLIFDLTTKMAAMKKKKKRWTSTIIQASAIPKEFYCPITLDLMSDPVIVSTGQTYDRSSITQWLDEGHTTCPNSGQTITDTDMIVSNHALRNLIHNWCANHQAVDYDAPPMENCRETPEKRAVCRAVWQANNLTSQLLVRELAVGPVELKGLAAHELRLLAKAGKESRTCIVEAGLFLSCQTYSPPHPRRLHATMNSHRKIR